MTIRWRKAVKLILVGVLLLTVVFVVLVGPWPNYQDNFRESSYFEETLARLNSLVPEQEPNSERSGFHAGWGVEVITPPVGTPLAGYGDRKGRPSTGVHDDLYVKALAVGDGVDTAIIVGSDLLVVAENIADRVRELIGQKTALTGDEILFNASHNHSGPGGYAPGVISGIFNGEYDPAIYELLVERFVAAIRTALDQMGPATFSSGGVEVPDLIRNRERADAPVDSELSYLRVDKSSGERCALVSYSAHPTVLGGDNFKFTGEYPGFMMRALGELLDSEVIYLGGAVGSMTHQAPEAPTRLERSQAMGRALAERVAGELENSGPPSTDANVEVVGFPMELPPYQLRLTRRLRLSPMMLPMLGIDHDAWIQGVRIGQVVLAGMPADYCGEISVKLKAAAQAKGIDLWVLSFNGDYVGYISPDEYYNDLEENGTLGYERGVMSWIGPEQEAYTSHLIELLTDSLF